VAALLILCGLWWVAMGWAAWQGQVSPASWLVAGAVASLACALPSRWLWRAPQGAAKTVWWQPAAQAELACLGQHRDASSEEQTDVLLTPWLGALGQPLVVTVLADLGVALVVRVRCTATSASMDAVHWISQSELSGPWRWRFVRASMMTKVVPVQVHPMKAAA
jgi:hypothetical protein